IQSIEGTDNHARAFGGSYDYNRACALGGIAQQMVQEGQIQQAIEVASSIEEARERAWVLSAIARGLAQTGQVAQTVEICMQAIEAVRSSTEFYPFVESDARFHILQEIAQQLAQVGQIGLATSLAHSIKFAHDCDRILGTIAQHLAKLGQIEQAIKVAHSIKAASSVEANHGRVWAL